MRKRFLVLAIIICSLLTLTNTLGIADTENNHRLSKKVFIPAQAHLK
ncbi:MAG: hypothetical protein FD167_4635, partial [bacterium]